MRPRSAAVIAMRVFSIILAVQVVTQSIAFLIISDNLEGSGEFWALTGTSAAIAWFLWIAAVQLSGAMASGTPDEAPASPRSTANAHAVAISVVGIILVAQAIPGLVAIAITEQGGRGGFPLVGFPTDFSAFDRGAAIATQVVRILIGLILVGTSGQSAAGLARRYPEQEAPPTSPPGTP